MSGVYSTGLLTVKHGECNTEFCEINCQAKGKEDKIFTTRTLFDFALCGCWHLRLIHLTSWIGRLRARETFVRASINLQWRAACRLGILVLQVCISICYDPSSNFMGVWVRVIVCAYPCLCLCLWFLCVRVRVFTCCVCVRAREKKLPGIFYFQGDFTSPHLRAALLWKPVSPLRSFSWKNCPTINRQ